MERKTTVHAEDGRPDLVITRDFDLPVALLFKAYTDAGIIAQWMGTRVVSLENRQHGSYRFETSDPQGNVVFSAHGAIHEVTHNHRIVRTFQMEQASFDVQLEFLSFEPLSDHTSRLTIHSIYRSPALRDQQLRLPFAYGINMAHDRLQHILKTLN